MVNYFVYKFKKMLESLISVINSKRKSHFLKKLYIRWISCDSLAKTSTIQSNPLLQWRRAAVCSSVVGLLLLFFVHVYCCSHCL